MDLPAIVVDGREEAGWTAINDLSFHRKPGLRVADLSYAVGDEEIGRVRSDGIVVSTPAGSTGYNLANGGPVMAWGVEGYAVSFIAPHSLTARALVVAPQDSLAVSNRSREEPIDVTVDGRPSCAWVPGSTSSRARPARAKRCWPTRWTCCWAGAPAAASCGPGRPRRTSRAPSRFPTRCASASPSAFLTAPRRWCSRGGSAPR